MEIEPTFEPLNFGFTYPQFTFCQSIIDDHEGFRILLSAGPKERWLRIGFSHSVAYRKMNEGDFLKTFPKIPTPLSIAYEVFNSEFVKWFNLESCGVRENSKLRNFLFLSAEDIIEVLHYDAPKIELL